MKLLSKVIPAALVFLSANLFSIEPVRFFLHEMKHQDFIEAFKSNTSTIIKVEVGTRLPITLESSSSVFSIESSESAVAAIVVNMPLYVKIAYPETGADCFLCDGAEDAVSQVEMLFSQDQVTWKSFEELFTGNIFVAVSAEEEQASPFAKVCIDLEVRN